MSSDLQNKLEELAGTNETKGGALVLCRSGTPAAMAAILRAIDNTILPRLLELKVGASHISVLAGGRRLRAIHAVSGDLPSDGLELGQPLSRDDEAMQNQVGQLFKALTAKEGVLTLLRKIDPKASDQSDGGLEIGGLAKSWDVDLNATPPSALAQFIFSLGEDVLSHVEFGGDGIIDESGAADLNTILKSDELQEKVTSIQKETRQGQNASGKNQVIVLSGHLPDGALLCVTQIADSSALLAVQKKALSSVATAWSHV